MTALIFMVPTYAAGSGSVRRKRCLPSRVCLSRVPGELVRQPGHLALQTTTGTTDVGSGQVDPGLDLGQLGAPSFRLACTRRAPRLDHPGPLKKKAGSLDPSLGSSSELMTLCQVRGVALQRCSCLVQIIGSGSQCP